MSGSSPFDGRWLRAALIALLVGWVGGLVTTSVLFPPYRAPDEGPHVDMVRLHQDDPSPFVTYRLVAERSIAPARLTGFIGQPEDVAPLPAEAAPPRSARPSFARSAPDVPTQARNQQTQHPQTYYLLNAAVQRGIGSVTGRPTTALPYDLQLALMRGVSIAQSAALPLVCYLTARRLGLARWQGVVASTVVLGIPRVSHLGMAVNNDALLIAATSVAFAGLAAVVRGRDTAATAVLVGLAGAVALLAKGFGLVVVPWIGTAYLARAARGGRRALARGALALGLTLALGGWWYLRNLAVYGTVQPDHASYPVAGSEFSEDPGWWGGFALQRLVGRFWIEPNIVQGLPRVEFVPAALVALGCVAGAVVLMRSRRAGLVAFLLWPTVASLCIVLFGAWRLYLQTGHPHGLDGRYVHHGLVGVACLVAGGGAALPGPLRRWLPALTLAAAIAAQLYAVDAALGFYWGNGGGALGDSVRALVAWSPLPPFLVGLAALAWAGGLLTALALAVGAAQPLRPALTCRP